MNKYALLGEHLTHSYSKILHTIIFEEKNIDATYELLELKKEDLKSTINKLKTKEYMGFNVTIPYKIEVMQYLDYITPEAKAIGSVNTIAYTDGLIVGYNTDYYGFLDTLMINNIEVSNKDCYILGTGGASLAVKKVLADLGANIFMVSRNKTIDTLSYEDLEYIEKIDLIVNTTPVGMFPNVDASPINDNIIDKTDVIIDIIFNPLVTKLISKGKVAYNGLMMLVGQAIKAEEIWHDKNLDLDKVKILKKVSEMI